MITYFTVSLIILFAGLVVANYRGDIDDGFDIIAVSYTVTMLALIWPLALALGAMYVGSKLVAEKLKEVMQ